MAHIHSVYDTDKHFTIEPGTRELVAHTPEKNCIMQYDHDSERITFDLPAVVEGHNILDCNRVEVHYLNIDAKTKDQRPGLYVVDDLQISPADEAVAVCSWLISMNATQLVGPLYFRVTFKCVTEGNVDYSWSTAIYKGLAISDGINCTEYVAAMYADVLADFDTRIAALEQGGGTSGGGTVELDTTLTQSGKAADAKAVGDALAGKQPKGDYVKRVNGVAPDDSGNVAVPSGADGVSSWNDLTDRPFGGEAGMEITFDPKTHTEPPIGTISGESVYFVSDKIISNEALKLASLEIVHENTGDQTQTTVTRNLADDWEFFEGAGLITEDYAIPEVFVVTRKNNMTLPFADLVFERAGLYVLYKENAEYTAYLGKITIPEHIKTLDPMFLPMADIVNEVLAAIPNAEGASF